MAAHYVKCYYCGKTFDANRHEWVRPMGGLRSTRYAHRECEENRDDYLTPRQKLETYVQLLFGAEYKPARVTQQINSFKQTYNYTENEILLTLKYFYDIKGHDTKQANGGIGIVPYVYDEAKQYYYSLWLTEQKNREVALRIKQEQSKRIEVSINSPQRKPKKLKLFDI